MSVNRAFLSLPFPDTADIFATRLQKRGGQMLETAGAFDTDIQLRRTNFVAFAGDVALDEPSFVSVDASWLSLHTAQTAVRTDSRRLNLHQQRIRETVVEEQQTVELLKRLSRVTADNQWIAELLLKSGQDTNLSAALMVGQLGVIVADVQINAIGSSVGVWRTSRSQSALSALRDSVEDAREMITEQSPEFSKDILAQGRDMTNSLDTTHDELLERIQRK